MGTEEVTGSTNIDVFPWLKSLPLAPEYHPTLSEFQDPIAYIFKIEKEASQFGICKIVPPVPPASRKTLISNLNKSLLSRSPDASPTFTTRQQQIGFCPRKHRPVQKPVWQSGERYTVSEFEAKAKSFEKSYLKKYVKKDLNALEIETLYWSASVDKPFDVEYANDMPGSGFVSKRKCGGGGGITVGDTEWNMRSVSRASLSLLRFMKEDIPGVTSPMVYLAMMFSWFAWHVEDHDLHSLNYLHMGAGKTWYGVPREAAVAFEEVVREHGYGGEINPLVTFATLGEKTTVMSPQVLRNAGVPCCRLVQNAGEFVITFPRAYHSGFSHGFNCGEASNIATPEWLRIAKEAAVRRASINCPPMVSHFQLLYDLALSLCSSVPKSISAEPRSSRLKDKKKSEGDMLIKELFSQDMMQNNNMLHILGKGSPIVLLSQNSLTNSKSLGGSQSSRLFPSLCSPDLELKATGFNLHDELMIARKQGMNKPAMGCAVDGKNQSLYNSDGVPSRMGSEMKKASQTENGLFSCVTCGILCFACVAIVQPTEAAASYLMSADCSIFSELGVVGNNHDCISDVKAPITNTCSGLVLKDTRDGLVDAPVCASNQFQTLDDETVGPSSLGLLALTYGNSSDSEEDEGEAVLSSETCRIRQSDSPENGPGFDSTDSNSNAQKLSNSLSSFDASEKVQTNNCTLVQSNFLTCSFRHQTKYQHATSNCTPISYEPKSTLSSDLENTIRPFSSRADEDSSRLHVFCLQHAIQVEKWLNTIGGADVFLVCHPDYPKLESEARKIADEMQKDDLWSKISFREGTEEDEETMRLALDSENAIHGNGDWAVKMGINLFYSANLSRSPLYSKQMPYNFILYSAFGRGSPPKDELQRKGFGRQRKVVVAGKWCGKVWMSNQAHPLLVNKDYETELKNETPSESNETCKISRKRKSTAKVISVEAVKVNEISRDFTLSNFHKRTRSKNVSKRVKKEKSPEAEKLDESCKTSRKKKSTTKIISIEAVKVDEISRDFTLSNFHKQTRSKKVSKQVKKEKSPEAEKLDESSEEFDSCKRSTSRRRTMRLKEEITEAENLDDSAEEFDSCTQITSRCRTKRLKKEIEIPEAENLDDSSDEFPISNAWKQIKGKLRMEKKTAPKPQNDQTGSKKQFYPQVQDEPDGGPSTRLRKRVAKNYKDSVPRLAKSKTVQTKQPKDVTRKGPTSCNNRAKVIKDEEGEYSCDLEVCTMSFGSKHELTLHNRNTCPEKGCGKKFFSHKYLLQHRRVHMDDRPLKCPWKGCKRTFKWAWARTEHIRVHTGARPYVCTEKGCGQTFRFVSDFSRHKRKTGHVPKKSKGSIGREKCT